MQNAGIYEYYNADTESRQTSGPRLWLSAAVFIDLAIQASQEKEKLAKIIS
jgi:hypothetical protein